LGWVFEDGSGPFNPGSFMDLDNLAARAGAYVVQHLRDADLKETSRHSTAFGKFLSDSKAEKYCPEDSGYPIAVNFWKAISEGFVDSAEVYTKAGTHRNRQFVIAINFDIKICAKNSTLVLDKGPRKDFSEGPLKGPVLCTRELPLIRRVRGLHILLVNTKQNTSCHDVSSMHEELNWKFEYVCIECQGAAMRGCPVAGQG